MIKILNFIFYENKGKGNENENENENYFNYIRVFNRVQYKMH